MTPALRNLYLVVSFLLALAPAACGEPEERASDDTACQPDDNPELVVRRIAGDCVDATSSISVGCAATETPDARLLYFECWEDAKTGERVAAPVPLANLRKKGNWRACPDVDDLSWATACQEDDCERHSATLCSFEDTCAEIGCGDDWSPYRADGCRREKGDSCTSNDDCEAPQVCSLFQPQDATRCAYDAINSCFCQQTGIGPTENGWCTEP